MSSLHLRAAASIVISQEPLGFPFKTLSPFLFCVYHHDKYPAGDALMQAPRKGNGADFDWSQPYRMYHGDRIPGFPQHPHRGFETLTYVREGVCDHTDSLGNAGRYGGAPGGGGDLQWMTAGKGCVHGEMFPLVRDKAPNTLKLFQADKFVEPGFLMHWGEDMNTVAGDGGASCTVVVGAAGSTNSKSRTPPGSWARHSDNHVGLFYIDLPPRSSFILPASPGGAAVNRVAYLVEGGDVHIGGVPVKSKHMAVIDASVDAEFKASQSEAQVLVLQGRPIDEPVAQHGPFVMNTKAEIQQAFADYQKTRFGGWPWPEDAVVFPKCCSVSSPTCFCALKCGQEKGRFARFAEGGGSFREEFPADAAAAADL